MKLMSLALIALTGATAFGSPALANYDYVNEEQLERFERAVAPFKAGDVPPMTPSNYVFWELCEWPTEYQEWKRRHKAWRSEGQATQINTEAGTYIDVYYFDRLLNVLETRDCSCGAQTPDTAKARELTLMLPISTVGNLKTRSFASKFYQRRALGTLSRLASEFCGAEM